MRLQRGDEAGRPVEVGDRAVCRARMPKAWRTIQRSISGISP
jgi:hypothetical protein